MRLAPTAIAILAGLSSTASAQASAPRSGASPESAAAAPPLRIVLPVTAPGCEARPDDDEIIVCGRKGSPYRIDPAVLAGTRAREARDDRRPEQRTTVSTEKCSPVGGMSCGENVLPVSAIALTVVTAAVKAAKGEDLRPMLRTRPSEYEAYQHAKSQTAAEGTPAPK